MLPRKDSHSLTATLLAAFLFLAAACGGAVLDGRSDASADAVTSPPVSLDALGATIRSSAPAKANCGDNESNDVASSIGKWFAGADYCSHMDGTFAELNYSVGYNKFSNGTGYGIRWMQSFIATGPYSFTDAVCIQCNNDPRNPVCSFPSPVETQTGNLPGTYPPSEYVICPTGDFAYQATAHVQVN